MITILISLIVGFIAGALVFRNNAKKAEQVVQGGQAALDKAKTAVEKLKNK